MGKKPETASRRLTAEWVKDIMEGRLSAGERLPTERELAEQYHLSRHVVREALKRLEALRLIQIKQGSGAYVADITQVGGIELMEYIVEDETDELDTSLIDEYTSFWQTFVGHVVGLAAKHRTKEQMQKMWEIHAQRGEAIHASDMPTLLRLNREMTTLMGQATHNRVYQMFFNNLTRVLYALRASIPLSQIEPLISQASGKVLLEAIEEQDAEMASLLASRLLDVGRKYLKETFQRPSS